MFLIVEDNDLMAKNIKTILQLSNFEAEIAPDAETAKELLKKKKYELIILDVNLPGQNGFEFLKELRQNWNDIPIFVVTSKNTSDDIIEGLELWADDYISKPFDMGEFIARIKAILRRKSQNLPKKIEYKDLEIYPEKEKVLKNGREIQLSSLEFKLLMYFLKNKGKILSREEIYEEVWGDFYDHMFSRTVDVYISYLRKKLGQDIILTKKGSGYYIE